MQEISQYKPSLVPQRVTPANRVLEGVADSGRVHEHSAEGPLSKPLPEAEGIDLLATSPLAVT